MSRVLKIHGATLLWAALIFILSSIPHLHPPDFVFSIKDAWMHGIEYGIFGYLLQRSGRDLFGGRFWVFLLAIVVGVIYGGLDEVHQSFVDGRQSTWADFFADSVGVLFGTVIFIIYKK
jgi:VanZ family protein